MNDVPLMTVAVALPLLATSTLPVIEFIARA
jgi:hypothetical protein